MEKKNLFVHIDNAENTRAGMTLLAMLILGMIGNEKLEGYKMMKHATVSMIQE